MVEPVNNEEIVAAQRLQRNRHLPSRLVDCVVLPDSAVNNEGELIQFALLADAEPINFKDAMQTSVWKKAMLDD
jgi:hypothetical protein